MKKLLDKPNKLKQYFITLIISSVIVTSNYYLYSMTTQHTTPSIVETEIVYEKAVAVVESKPEVVEVKKEEPIKPVQQPEQSTQQVVVASRGGSTVQPTTQRQMIQGYVREISTRYNNIDPYVIMSVIQTESTYNPKARNGNCLGLMQVSSYWHRDRAARLGVTDLYDPYSNVLVGIDYISEMLTQYKDIRLVLMMYNMSHDTALKMYKNGQISEYARTILNRAEQYRKGE